MKLSEYLKQQGHQLSHRLAVVEGRANSGFGLQQVRLSFRTPVGGSAPTSSLCPRIVAHNIRPTWTGGPERLIIYCTAKGYQVSRVVQEIASAVTDARPKLLALLEDQAITLIVVEQKARLTRFGFRYLETLLRGQGRALEVVNETGNETEDLLADLTSIIYSVCARLYGQRRAKRMTETILKELEAGEGSDATS